MRNLVRKFVPRAVRNWLRLPAASLKYVRDRLASALGHSPKVRITDQWEVWCHPAAAPLFEIFRTDPDQAKELASFVQHCHPDMRLLDAGAHFGFFALAALQYGGEGARVLCVEVSPNAVKVLKQNLDLNRARGKVTVVNEALGGEDGVLRMLTTGPLGADYFVLPTGARNDTIDVPQRCLSSLLEKENFDPTHIKLDIEGAELEVIESSLDLLAVRRPVIFLELHGTALAERGKDPFEVLRLLRHAGYTSFSADGGDMPVEGEKNWKSSYRMVCQ